MYIHHEQTDIIPSPFVSNRRESVDNLISEGVYIYLWYNVVILLLYVG